LPTHPHAGRLRTRSLDSRRRTVYQGLTNTPNIDSLESDIAVLHHRDLAVTGVEGDTLRSLDQYFPFCGLDRDVVFNRRLLRRVEPLGNRSFDGVSAVLLVTSCTSLPSVILMVVSFLIVSV
jgi:hypothetical protein